MEHCPISNFTNKTKGQEDIVDNEIIQQACILPPAKFPILQIQIPAMEISTEITKNQFFTCPKMHNGEMQLSL